jgi:hypothetical protein
MPLFGQQDLWTTKEVLVADDRRAISLNQVKAEILKFAGQYGYYSELSGYSFDNEPSGNGRLFLLELQLNGNKGFADATNVPLNGRQTVSFRFVHRQGLDYLVFHDGVITGGMPVSNRRGLEALIDRLITNCR